ncbi:MAG: hypothetical protein WBP13_03230 [Methylophilaceae bacterium]
MALQPIKQGSLQQGVVLFFALIALVVMSLAAAALIRSVDTSTLVAGNLSFKRSATISADSGTESAVTWLIANTDATLTNSISTDTYYYPTSAADAKTLVNGATAKLATGTDIDALGTDKAGNTISYIIQRMCTTAGAVTATNCVLSGFANANNDETQGESLPIVNTAKAPVYRVTTKVVGPKNTVSYVQAFIG